MAKVSSSCISAIFLKTHKKRPIPVSNIKVHGNAEFIASHQSEDKRIKVFVFRWNLVLKLRGFCVKTPRLWSQNKAFPPAAESAGKRK